MSRIANIRERSKLNEELYSKKVSRVREAVTDYMQSDVAKLTIANHFAGNEEVKQSDLDRFADDLSQAAVNAYSDSVADFEDSCHARGWDDAKIAEMVESLSKLLRIPPETDAVTKKMKVAEFMQSHDLLYDEFCR